MGSNDGDGEAGAKASKNPETSQASPPDGHGGQNFVTAQNYKGSGAVGIGNEKMKAVEKGRERSRKRKPGVPENDGPKSGSSDLTISYEGKVHIFQSVTREKVQAILMLLGGIQTPFGMPKLAIPYNQNERGLAEVHKNLNLSRRITSLIRLREKRKERVQYSVHKGVTQSIRKESKECSLQLNDTSQTAEDLPSAMLSRFEGKVPKIGMVFQSDEEAYEFYNQYARSVGFSIRKGSSTHRSDKTISRRIFCCSKEGLYRDHPRGPPIKPRLHSRTDCKARFLIKLQGDGNYTLVEFVEEHNHELAPPTEVHVLRSHRRTRDAEVLGDVCRNAEIAGSKSLNAPIHCTNCLQNNHDDTLKKEAAEHLLGYFTCMQKESPYFFYSMQMGENDQVCSCFWTDAKSRIDYGFFGDVVCLDTRYRVSGYDKPYTLFVGVNNHGQLIVFGCGLLLVETTESFEWLLGTFLDAMNGKQPKTIFTDQTTVIVDAVRQILPNTSHHFSLWNIYQTVVKNLSHVLEEHNSFMEDFKSCIYNNRTEDDFQFNWHAFLDKYSLTNNECLQGLYQICKNWVQVYGRESFSAGLTTTETSEGMDEFLKKHFKKFMSVQDFITQYDKAVTSSRDKERDEDFISRRSKANLRTTWLVEGRAAERYTPKIFALFQEEYIHTLDLFVDSVVENGTTCIYKVSSFENVKPRTVTFNTLDKTVTCSCKYFEMTGILCSHALKVLHDKQLPDLPSQYYLNRWTKDARAGAMITHTREKSTKFNIRSSFTLLFTDLAYIAVIIAVKGASTENSSTFTKGLLIHVLEELDGFLNSDFDQARALQGARNAIISLRDPSHKKAKSKASAKPKVTVEKGKGNGKTPSKTKGVDGSNRSNEVTDITTQPPASSDIPNLSINTARHWNSTQYAQGSIAQVGQAMFPHSDTGNTRYELMSSGWNSAPWRSEVAPQNALGCLVPSGLEGLSFRPARPLSMLQEPCAKGLAGLADQAISNHSSDNVQPNQGFIGFLTHQSSSQRQSEPPLQQHPTQHLEISEPPEYR